MTFQCIYPSQIILVLILLFTITGCGSGGNSVIQGNSNMSMEEFEAIKAEEQKKLDEEMAASFKKK